MTYVQLEDFLNGVATGNYVRKVGSQFGSLWGFDGLMAAEATPEECAAFGASSKMNLCHGGPVTWLGHEWSTILAYSGQKLAQINIHTDYDDVVFNEVCAGLQACLAQGREFSLPDDTEISVLRRIEWSRPGGEVTLVHTPAFIQVSVAPPGKSRPSAGCLGVFLLIAGGLSLVASFA